MVRRNPPSVAAATYGGQAVQPAYAESFGVASAHLFNVE
jgi:hypothetical protein